VEQFGGGGDIETAFVDRNKKAELLEFHARKVSGEFWPARCFLRMTSCAEGMSQNTRVLVEASAFIDVIWVVALAALTNDT
jgi:hypothetical protein